MFKADPIASSGGLNRRTFEADYKRVVCLDASTTITLLLELE